MIVIDRNTGKNEAKRHVRKIQKAACKDRTCSPYKLRACLLLHGLLACCREEVKSNLISTVENIPLCKQPLLFQLFFQLP